MQLSRAIRGFLLARSADGLSENTLIDYERTLRTVAAFLADPDIEAVTTDDLRRYLDHLRRDYVPTRMSGDASPLSPKTIKNHWIALASFYKWAARELGVDNALAGIKPPQTSQATVEPFTQDEVQAILKACERTKTASTEQRLPFTMRRPTAARDRALILLLLDTGLRASECAKLTVGDVDLGTGEVTVKGFGSGRKSRPRHVYLGRVSRTALWRYLGQREDGEDASAPLFVSVDSRPMNRTSIRQLCKKLGTRAGVSRCYPHRFRHTFAITYLRNGGDVFTLQRLLGHSSLDMVQRYVRLASADDAAAHRKASPADNWRL
ncbi:MAG: tyrosine-type recombinase/integrase [Anaerolineales bacterium]|nr:tyrosine-type recombinase/integrase [Anaerolineales bacterium]